MNLPTAKLMRDTAYLATVCSKTVHNCLSTSKGTILNVRPSDGFGILIYLNLGESFFAGVC